MRPQVIARRLKPLPTSFLKLRISWRSQRNCRATYLVPPLEAAELGAHVSNSAGARFSTTAVTARITTHWVILLWWYVRGSSVRETLETRAAPHGARVLFKQSLCFSPAVREVLCSVRASYRECSLGTSIRLTQSIST